MDSIAFLLYLAAVLVSIVGGIFFGYQEGCRISDKSWRQYLVDCRLANWAVDSSDGGLIWQLTKYAAAAAEKFKDRPNP